MNVIIIGILLGIASFFALQMILPFPYGLVAWFIILWLIIRYAKKYTVIQKDSVLNYRRIDPINEKEKDQNDEALRILEKKYIEEKISKEEYLKRKKEFLDIEYNPRKCKVCGSEEFEFISEKRSEKPDEDTYDIGYYKCKKCGTT
ncbi:hypothetical protein [Nitrosarchaeum sp. AC2]|uniref:hypothetical protein n=1 Tax=Nitrosarchaeum sp. AC2 TaxID=2259673 RepID=UPI0015C96AE8|nr:hypothetical protein [Nitrosarchaeum sp. AC2]QLH10857.1 hypothetical protein DSQ20_04750 [Nitrosarchaeum sp. AC2]